MPSKDIIYENNLDSVLSREKLSYTSIKQACISRGGLSVATIKTLAEGRRAGDPRSWERIILALREISGSRAIGMEDVLGPSYWQYIWDWAYAGKGRAIADGQSGTEEAEASEPIIAAQRFLADQLIVQQADAIAASTRSSKPLSAIVGVGIGRAQSEEDSEGYVLNIYATDEQAAAAAPRRFRGVRVQTRVVGEFRTSAGARSTAPLVPGVSIGHSDGDTGTLGCFVKDDSRIYILSNNHVLAKCNGASEGDDIVHPGLADSHTGEPAIVGHLSNHYKLMFHRRRRNWIDAAIAEVHPSDRPTQRGIPSVGDVTQWRQISKRDVGSQVRKVGRSTGFTQGDIYDWQFEGVVGYDSHGLARFARQIIIVPPSGESSKFAEPGDSGSLVVDAAGQAIGLLFAVSNKDGSAMVCPIDRVLAALEVTLA